MPQTNSHSSSTKARASERSADSASVTPSAAPSISAEAVAGRAYEKFVARGCSHGCDREDWLAAEQELVAEAGNGSH